MLSLGPSSKVRAMARRVVSPRQREGPKTEEERPRTAHAMEETAARAAAVPMGKEAMRVYCSEGGCDSAVHLDGAVAPTSFPDCRWGIGRTQSPGCRYVHVEAINGRKQVQGGRSWLQQSLKVLDLELTVAEDFVQQPGADRLARMCRYHRASSHPHTIRCCYASAPPRPDPRLELDFGNPGHLF